MLDVPVKGVTPTIPISSDHAGKAVPVKGEVHIPGSQAHHDVSAVHSTDHLDLPVVVVGTDQPQVPPDGGGAGAVGWVEEYRGSVLNHNTRPVTEAPAPTQFL